LFSLPFHLLFTNFFSFFCFSPFSLFPFMPFLYHLDTSPPVPFHLDLGLRDYIPPLNFSVTEFFIVLISFLPSVFPCPSVRFIMFLGLLTLLVVTLP
jgi:hypothetical protein